MAKYVKKPIPITAIQWTGHNKKEIMDFTGNNCRFREGKISIIIPTLEGDMGAMDGDFIVKGVDGEFYPCKQEIFLKTYEKISE